MLFFNSSSGSNTLSGFLFCNLVYFECLKHTCHRYVGSISMKSYNWFMFALIVIVLGLTGYVQAASKTEVDLRAGFLLATHLSFQMILGQVGWLVKKTWAPHSVWAVGGGVAIFGVIFWGVYAPGWGYRFDFWDYQVLCMMGLLLIQLTISLGICAARRPPPKANANATI